MYNLIYQNNKFTYGLKKFVVDTIADISEIPATTLSKGSTAFVRSTADTYIYGDNNTWSKLPKSSGGSSGGGDNPSEDNTYIWDGGDIG